MHRAVAKPTQMRTDTDSRYGLLRVRENRQTDKAETERDRGRDSDRQKDKRQTETGTEKETYKDGVCQT